MSLSFMFSWVYASLKYLLHPVARAVLSNGPEIRSGSDPQTIGLWRVSVPLWDEAFRDGAQPQQVVVT